MATLTYVYSDSTAVVGPLATYAEPHTYDLCTEHADRLTPPRGWDIVRLAIDKVFAVGEGVRAVRALHQGAVMEGSWGEESELLTSIDGVVDRLREPDADSPAPGDIVLVAGGDLADAVLAYWRDEAGVEVEVLTR